MGALCDRRNPYFTVVGSFCIHTFYNTLAEWVFYHPESNLRLSGVNIQNHRSLINGHNVEIMVKYTSMKIQIITLFPEMFPGVMDVSMLWKAQDKGHLQISYINLRDFGLGPRKTVDDTPYGGGDGMLLKPEPLFAAVEVAKKNDLNASVLLMTARGERWIQATAQTMADDQEGLILICGRYEGYDERITSVVDKQISIGDYVLTGGELPAMIIVDSIVRLIPGVLGGEQSAEIESFSDGKTLEFPQYTRPEEFNGMKVPEVLLSGNHAKIAQWRKEQSDLQSK
jgi:tRNA (guanine37-N1)-methyltransferase